MRPPCSQPPLPTPPTSTGTRSRRLYGPEPHAGACTRARCSSAPPRPPVPRSRCPAAPCCDTAAVTRVGVRADRTRRGVLTALMHAPARRRAPPAGEALASLRATEARIYGRFGYGVATRGREVRRQRPRVRPASGRPGRRRGAAGRPRATMLAGARRRCTSGSRSAGTGGDHPRRSLVATSASSGLAGRAHARRGGRAHRPGRRRRLPGGHGRTTGRLRRPTAAGGATCTPPAPQAAAALWRFLLDVDLVGDGQARAAPARRAAGPAAGRPARLTRSPGCDDETVAAARGRAGGAGRAPVRRRPSRCCSAVHDTVLETNAGVYRIAAARRSGSSRSAGRWRRSLPSATSPGSRWPTSATAAPSELAADRLVDGVVDRPRSPGPTRRSPPRQRAVVRDELLGP